MLTRLATHNDPDASRARRVLVVEDDASLRLLLSAVLTSRVSEFELEVSEAPSFKAANAAMQDQHGFDLVLLDNYLGDGEGVDLLPDLMAAAKSWDRAFVPVIMISGNHDQSFLASCFSRGASDYVVKPFDVNLLAFKVNALLQSQTVQEQLAEQNSLLLELIAEREQEESMARFAYDYLLRRTHLVDQGVFAQVVSCSAFGGDLVLSARTPGGRYLFMLTDATGHGLSAAITLLPLVRVFQGMAQKGFGLQQILIELNRHLLSDTPDDRFVAAICLELDPLRDEIKVWNGGMPALLQVGQDGSVMSRVCSSHMALGILSDDLFDVALEPLSLVDTHYLLMVSDGVTEQMSPEHQPFGHRRLEMCLRADPDITLDVIMQALEHFRASEPVMDDLSVCVVAPQRVLQSLSDDSMKDELDPLTSLRHHSPFKWQLSQAGLELGQHRVPLLFSQFLQEMGADQALSERVFTILAELCANAVDHGLLGLDSQIKEQVDGFTTYLALRDERLSQLTDADRIDVLLSWTPTGENSHENAGLIIEVCDTGEGFDMQEIQKRQDRMMSGRGLVLVASLSTQLEVLPPGNLIKVRIG